MASAFDRNIVNRVQQANDIVELVAEHVSLTKKGREMVGLCPFHDDHSPSMNVNPVKQIFKCFACGAGGDVFKFVQMRENLTFPQAIERLAERAGIEIKPIHRAKTKSQISGPDPNSLARVNVWAAEHFHRNLTGKRDGESVRAYLAERKITPQSIKTWKLGLAVTNNRMAKAAKLKGISPELLTGAGLAINQNSGLIDKFANRLMFSITDVTGRVIGFGGRTLDGKGAKYINSPATALFDKSNSMYGLQQAHKKIASTETAVVVEGYTDCIMAHQFGCENVVATLGTSFTTGHARILRRYAKKIVLIFDGDTAGIEAANRAMEVCLAQRVDIKIATVPEGKDPCDFLITAGKEKFEQLIDEAVDVFEFKWNRLTENLKSKDSFIDNKAAIEEFLQTIATAVQAGNLSAIDKGLIVNRLSGIIGIDSKQINQELDSRLRRTQRAARYSSDTTTSQAPVKLDLGSGLFAVAQREILEVLLNEPKLFEIAEQRITNEDFDVPVLGKIATILFETLKAEPQATPAQILSRVESVQASACLTELIQAGEEKGSFESRLNGALEVMERCKRKNQIRTIEDKKQFLRQLGKNAGKENRHNIGMI